MRKDNKQDTKQDEISDLWPGQSIELLKALHILTRDGKLNQDSRRKLKQVQHLVQLVTPHLRENSTVADLGAGKSYLGFMLYDLWMRNYDETKLFAIEQRGELVESCRKIAKVSKFDRVQFVESSIQQALDKSELPDEIDSVLALHACDTATDEAIAFAVKKKARFIALVPCCQAEVARLLTDLKSDGDRDMATLWAHGIHRREFGSHLTNVIRCLFLESLGYKVRVTELVGWEHSMKNELILAERHQLSNPRAERDFRDLLKHLPVDKEPHRMRLFDLLGFS